MKATFKYIVTAFAVCATLVSCQKDNLTCNADDKPAVGNARVIEVHFGTATKSTLGGNNGRTPIFSNGDKIMASNGTSKEECSISVDNNGDASFTTTLTGDLTAIYPSAAAKLNDNAIEGFIVPATQDGTFAKANIAKATIASDATSATFENQTSLLRFYVDESIGVKSITITADEDIADNSKTIVVDPEGDTTLDKVTDDPGKRICYVSVLPGTFTSLKFTSVTTTQTLCENSTVERTAPNVTLTANKIYNAFIPYYIDLGTAGKWGYCNVGAFLPEDAGMYFAWGETTGYKPETDGEGAFTDGFCMDNYLFFNINTDKYKKYMLSGYEKYWEGDGDPDNLTQLESRDDAATANWGNGWRMPKATEFEALISLCSGDFASGLSFGTSPDAIFLPAAGIGIMNDLYCGEGLYWSSSLCTVDDPDNKEDGPDNGITFELYDDGPCSGYTGRCLGCSIRPFVAEPANKPLPKPTETDEEEDIL